MGNTPMHVAVAAGNLPLVKLLDENGGDGTIKNSDEICPIEMSIKHSLKEITLHFMS